MSWNDVLKSLPTPTLNAKWLYPPVLTWWASLFLSVGLHQLQGPSLVKMKDRNQGGQRVCLEHSPTASKSSLSTQQQQGQEG